MDEPLILPVSYNGREYEFEMKVVPSGYVYRFVIMAEGHELTIETDEEQNYRVLQTGEPAAKDIDAGLVKAIADTLKAVWE